MTPNKERALRCLLTMPTKSAAAKAAGIAPRTLRTYFLDDEFMEAYQAEINGLLEDSCRQAQQALSPALQILREIAADTKTPSSVRVQAARSLIELSLKLTDKVDFSKKLADVERAVEAMKGVNDD